MFSIFWYLRPRLITVVTGVWSSVWTILVLKNKFCRIVVCILLSCLLSLNMAGVVCSYFSPSVWTLRNVIFDPESGQLETPVRSCMIVRFIYIFHRDNRTRQICIWSIDSHDKELWECNYPLVSTDEAQGLESDSFTKGGAWHTS